MVAANNTLSNESRDLCRGIFWIKDINHPDAELFFKIPTDEFGNSSAIYNSKNGSTYNHEQTWMQLHQNKPFDYYPRGRVDIQNGVARIFINPNLNTAEIIDLIKEEFHLYQSNGIKSVKVFLDNSRHYKCYLDR